MSQAKEEAKKFVEEAVARSQIVVFSKTFCPYCMKTKELFKNAEFEQYSIEIFELDKMPAGMPQGPAVQFTLAEMTGQKTVPSVWINGAFVGGNDVTQGLYKSGELQNRLNAASE